MKKYTVEKGSHDFKPNDQPFFTFSNKCDWSFQLTESMYYTREDPDYPYGSYNGWNKLGFGFTSFFSANNKCSVMVAYFPDETEVNRFDIVGYTNDKNGGWKAEKLANVGLGEYEGQTIWLPDEVIFKIKEKGSEQDYTFLQMQAKRPSFRRGIGAYFGGQYPWFREEPAQFFGESKY